MSQTKEQYLLNVLAEELGEFQKEILKCVRFTTNDRNPKEPSCTNLERANIEWNDILGTLQILDKECGIRFSRSTELVNAREAKIRYFSEHSRKLGVLGDSL